MNINGACPISRAETCSYHSAARPQALGNPPSGEAGGKRRRRTAGINPAMTRRPAKAGMKKIDHMTQKPRASWSADYWTTPRSSMQAIAMPVSPGSFQLAL